MASTRPVPPGLITVALFRTARREGQEDPTSLISFCTGYVISMYERRWGELGRALLTVTEGVEASERDLLSENLNQPHQYPATVPQQRRIHRKMNVRFNHRRIGSQHLFLRDHPLRYSILPDHPVYSHQVSCSTTGRRRFLHVVSGDFGHFLLSCTETN